MTVWRAIAGSLLGLFVEDGRLSSAVLAWLAVSWLSAEWLAVGPAWRGWILLGGLLAALLASILDARRRSR
jgi:hypothetical protein